MRRLIIKIRPALLLVILAVFIFMAGFIVYGQVRIHRLKAINKDSQLMITDLSQDIVELQGEIKKDEQVEETFFKGGINYHSLAEEYRLVPTKTVLMALPTDDAYHLRDIKEKTLIEVLDLAEVSGEFWYYASVPVYDTPSDYKGWIRKDETLEFTEDLEEDVRGDVTIKKGALVYPVSDYGLISDEVAEVLDADSRGYIIAGQEGYLQITSPGGFDFWVMKNEVVFPKAVD